MLNTFDKSRTQEERRAQRDKHIQMMDSIGALTDTRSISTESVEAGAGASVRSGNSKNSKNSRNGNRSSGVRPPPTDTMTKAKQFLWEEDTDEQSDLVINPKKPKQRESKTQRPIGYRASPNPGRSGRRSSIGESIKDYFTGGEKKPVPINPNQNIAPRSQSKDHLDFANMNLDDLSLCSSEARLRQKPEPKGCIANCGSALYKRRICITLMMAFVCAGSALTVVFYPHIFSKNDPKPAHLKNPDRFMQIKSKILKSGVSSQDDIDRKGTPQHEALIWVADVDDAKLDVDDNMIIQRYSLAVFYFATYVESEAKATHESKKTASYFDSSSISRASTRARTKADYKIWKNNENWMSSKGYCSWAGVACHQHVGTPHEDIYDDGNHAVTHLNLTSNNVRGQIPDEIAAFTDLRVLHLGDNMMSGTIPDNIGVLDQLVVLYLGKNGFTGTIPRSVGKMGELTHLYLYSNQFWGEIPTELNNAQELRALSLYNNKMSGNIPDLSKLIHLSDLYLEKNKLEGPIPKGFGKLKRLKDFRLSENELTSTIPKEIGDMDNLENLYLDRNSLTGKIPPTLSQLDHLEKFHAYENKLKGHLPYQLGSLENLQVLYLDNNQLSGSIPHSWGGNKIRIGMQDLQQLYLHNNKLSGKIPTEFGALEDMRNLQLHDNQITGPIPSEMGKLFKIKYIYMENNQLTGKIPNEISKLSKLERLRIHDNKLTGKVSDDICDLSSKSGGKLIEFYLDCDGNNPEVECDCCTSCF